MRVTIAMLYHPTFAQHIAPSEYSCTLMSPIHVRRGAGSGVLGDHDLPKRSKLLDATSNTNNDDGPLLLARHSPPTVTASGAPTGNI